MNPIEQFELKKLLPITVGGIDISFTNSSLFMLIAAFLIIAIPYLGLRRRSIVPGKFQASIETIYETNTSIILQYAGSEGLNYFPFILSINLFVLFSNILGILPGFFTVTSHFSVTLSLAMVVFLNVIFIGFFKHGLGFFKLFLPNDIPVAFAPFLILVEFISFFFKPITLSIRLFANMIAGHIVLELFISWVVVFAMGSLFFLSFIPFFVSIILFFFEIVIALLQTYIFTVLSCIYLKEVLELH